jgi:hypothetical protein
MPSSFLSTPITVVPPTARAGFALDDLNALRVAALAADDAYQAHINTQTSFGWDSKAMSLGRETDRTYRDYRVAFFGA